MKYNTILFRPRSLKIHIKETRRIVWGGALHWSGSDINQVSGNQRGNWKSTRNGGFNRKITYKECIFHCNVWLPEVYVNLAYRLGAPQPLFTYPIWYPMIFPQQSPNLTLMVPLSLYFSTMLTTTISWYNHYRHKIPSN